MPYIITLEKDGIIETWGQLTDLCFAHDEIKYETVKEKNFPFEYKGYRFTKVKHKTKTI